MSARDGYVATADELVRRIEALLPSHPEILTLESPWDLFRCGLKCDDIGPTFYQASWALAKVQRTHRSI
jgi:hypothetical protein